MCQVDSQEFLEKDTTMSYRPMNNAMQANIYMTCFLLLINLELSMREHGTTKHHQTTYIPYKQTKHAHVNEYMYKNENK